MDIYVEMSTGRWISESKTQEGGWNRPCGFGQRRVSLGGGETEWALWGGSSPASLGSRLQWAALPLCPEIAED